MRRAGLVVGQTLELLRGHVRAGHHDRRARRIAEDNIRSSGATPSFLGYHGFPGSICASVNDEVVHGIPGDRVLADGDVVSIDCGAIVDGLARRRGDHRRRRRGARRGDRADAGHRGVDVARHRRRAPGRPGHRHLPRRRAARPRRQGATASSRTTPATASAPRCTSRPTFPTSAAPARGRRWCPGLALAVEPMITLGHQGDRPPRGRLDGRHHRRQLGRALRAHLHDHAARAPGC